MGSVGNINSAARACSIGAKDRTGNINRINRTGSLSSAEHGW